MRILRAVKGLLGTEEQVTNLYNCDGCSNVFTKTWSTGEDPDVVTCPNCGSADVVLAVESP